MGRKRTAITTSPNAIEGGCSGVLVADSGGVSGRVGNGNLTNHQRKIICEFYKKNGGVMSQKDLAQWTKHEFGLQKTPAQSTISGILRRQHEFINMSTNELGIKKKRVVQHPALDNALANWVIQCAHRGITVQGDMTKEKAKHFAKMLQIPEEEQPEFSNGWLHSFQLRHNISFRKFNGDVNSHSTTINSSTTNQLMETTTTTSMIKKPIYFTTMEELVKETDKYQLNDIYAMEETGISYMLPPFQTVEDPIRIKKRFVMVLATNADGSHKIKPLFVSHHEKPKAFQKKTAEQHGLHYFANTKAWMTGVIFSRWIQQVDLSMRTNKRHILLFISDASSHVVSHLELTNVTVFFLPNAATTVTLNPMHAGLIQSFKRHFRRLHLRNAVEKEEDGKKNIFDVDVLQAMKWAMTSWEEIPFETIQKAWTLTNMIPGRGMDRVLLVDSDDAFISADILQQLQVLRILDASPLDEYLNDEAKYENGLHEEFFDIVETIEEVPDDEIEEEENDPILSTLTIQEKLKSIRDVVQILKERNETDESTISTLRRVQDMIRAESRATIASVAATLPNTHDDRLASFHAII